MDAMPRPRPPSLHNEPSRHGKIRWYVRVNRGARIRIRAEYGTPEFKAEYDAAINGTPLAPSAGPDKQSLAWLLARYRETDAWTNLSQATRRQRDNIFVGVLKTAGSDPFNRITKTTIEAGRERRKKTPSQARNFLDAMRGLFRWAKKAQHVAVDPTDGVDNPPRPKNSGFVPWTEEDVEAYQRRWPLGTRERVWLDVLLYSGLRRGDAVRYGRQHVKNRIGRIKLEKGGFVIMVTLPVLPVLERTLEAGPCGDLTFIVGARGEPLTKESFTNAFRVACNAAGVNGSAHGVRKISATTCANNGATVAQLKALYGWTSDSMPSLYTKSADRDRLGREAAHMMANDERTSIPSPHSEVRARTGKQ